MSQREAALVGMTEFAQRRKGWENARRERWEVARWMVWQEYLLSPFIRSGHKPGKPSDILPLAGDPVPEQRTAAECRIDEGTQRTLIEIFDELKKRNG